MRLAAVGVLVAAGSVATGTAQAAPAVSGAVVAWGSNGYGETSVPAGLAGVTAIAASGYHSLALQSDGTVVGWGSNGDGETSVPAGLAGVTAIAGGGDHSLALQSDGTVVAWGYNGFGQTSVPAGLTGVTAIAGGSFHSLALKSDGTVVGWGSNSDGQTSVPAGLAGVTAIAAGGDHSLALKSDGTVVAWGYNGYGETSVPAGLTGVTAIAGGGYHSLALKADGTVVAWGFNGDGQTSVPAGLTGVTAIAAGDYHSLAVHRVAPAFTADTPPASATVGAAYPGYTFTATGAPAPTFTVASGALPAGLTLDATTGDVTGAPTQAGAATFTVRADNGVDPAADSPAITITVAKAAQTVTITSTSPADAEVGSTYAVTATGGGSGNDIVFSTDTSSVCTVTDATVTFAHAGMCDVNADQAGSANYTAGHASQTVAVGKAGQTVAFTSTAPAHAVVGDTYTVSATGGQSGAPVTFSSATASTCTVSGSTVTFTGASTCTVHAAQSGDADYASGSADQSIAVTQPPPAGVVTPLAHPVRIVDTRAGVGAPHGEVGPQGSITVTVPGRPAGTTAVMVNLTAVGYTGRGSTYVSACPYAVSATTCVTTSALNVTGPGPIANEITVPLGADGTFRLINRTGSVDLVVDVTAYLRAGFVSGGPTRQYDSRTGTGAAPIGADTTRTITLAAVPAGARAAVINLTGTNFAGAGATYLSVCQPGQSTPACARTSRLNLSSSAPVANELTVPIGADGTIRLYNRIGTADVIVDVSGYLTSGYTPRIPTRILDTCTKIGATSAVGPGSSIVVTVPPVPAGTTAVTLNLTATGLRGSATSYVTACADTDSNTLCAHISTVNAVGTQPIANEITIPLPTDRKIRLYNRTGTIDLIADLTGTYP